METMCRTGDRWSGYFKKDLILKKEAFGTKILGTTAFLYGDMLTAIRSFGYADNKRQFRVICRYRGVKDANEKCMKAGLGSRIFTPSFTTETGNEEEAAMCGKEDIWAAKGGTSPYQGYAPVSELIRITDNINVR